MSTCSGVAEGIGERCGPRAGKELIGYIGGQIGTKKRQGHGVQEWRDGSRYEGEFLNGLKHGAGKFTWKNGEFYEGSFFKDYRHGPGRYSWPSGHRFIGKFYLNRKEGYGLQELPDGSTFQGLYRADERFGPGVVTYPDGRQDVGLWHREKLLRLCYSLEGGFTLQDYPEYTAHLPPPTAKASLTQLQPASPSETHLAEDAEQAKPASKEVFPDPLQCPYPDLLSDERFILPPDMESYSTDSDHLPVPPGLRRQLDQHFFGELWAELDQSQNPLALSALPLRQRLAGHIYRHRVEVPALGWDVLAVLSENRDRFGPKGPLELRSEQLVHEASLGNRQGVYRMLRDGKVHPDVGDARGHTPLIAATVNCHNEVVHLLLDRGADINQLNCEGMSALAVSAVLYYPIPALHTTVAERLLPKPQSKPQVDDSDSVNLPDEEDPGMNLSHHTIGTYEEQTEERRREDEEDQDKRKAKEDTEVQGVKWEKEQRGAVPAKAIEGQQRGSLSQPADEFDSARSLDSYPIQVTEEVMQRTAEALSRSGQPGQLRDTRETVGKMAAMKLQHRGRWATMKLLLDRGADPNTSWVPMPALFLAIKAGHVEAVQTLLECGARTDTPLPLERKGLYPLHISAGLPGKAGARITEQLLHAVADPDVRAQDAKETFSLDKGATEPQASFGNKTATASGPPADFYCAPKMFPVEGGRTALHVACQRDSDYANAREVVSLLLSHKASTHLLWSGHSPLSLAIASGNDLVVDELLAAGADPNLPLTRRVGSALCALTNISYDSWPQPRNRTKLLDKLVKAGANILMPVKVGEGRRCAVGTAVDYAYYAFHQDGRIAHTPYHTLSQKEREIYNSRRQILTLMGDLLRQAAIQLERDRQEGYYSGTEKFLYTGAGATPPKARTNKITPPEEQASQESLPPITEHRKPVFKYCYQCGRTTGVVLTTCTRCHEVYFCSKTCKMKSWNERHKEECVRLPGQPGSLAQQMKMHLKLGKNKLNKKLGKTTIPRDL
ncbi:ankyrin repeat and MYND domain-containing protein 1 [Aplochiton taeniatus]